MEKYFIIRWVARDKDNTLWIHSKKPNDENGYYVSDKNSFEIFNYNYPEFSDVKYEDGPIEIKISFEK